MKTFITLFAIIAFTVSANAQSQPPTPPSASSAPAQSVTYSGTVTGMALYRERIALPQNTVFEAVLEDTSLADAPAVRIGSYKRDNVRTPPFRFSISYDPAKIIESHTYSVRATLTVDGRLMFTSTTSHPVITKGNPSNVSIGLQSAGAGSSPAVASSSGVAAESLENTYWKLITLGSKPVDVGPGKREPSLILHPEGMRTEVFAGCNSMAGTYTLKGKDIHFSALAGTLMACDGTLMDIEKGFADALTEAATYRITGKHLIFIDAKNKTIAQFESRIMN
jgi:putative lipoprotein